MTEPPGDLWWVGLHYWWEQGIPSSVTKAESVLVNPIVRMPWVIVSPDGAETAPTDAAYPAWLTDPMLLNGSTGGPNRGRFPMLDRVDRFDFWARWIRDAMRYGIGAIAFEPGSDGAPVAGTMQTLAPTRVYRGDDGWAIDVAGTVAPIGDDGTIIGDPAGTRVVLLRHSIPGGVFGRHRGELRLASRVREFASESLDSGTPSGVLATEQPISQAQADTAREEWMRTQARRQIAVLGNGARYQQVVLSPVDAELSAMATASDRQVAHMYELGASDVDAPSGDSMTYANISERRQDRVDGPLASWSARVEETLGSLLGWRTRLTIDFRGYTKETTAQDVSA
jgi:phage portal protein BeeE